MADKKFQELTENTAPISTDIFPTVDDPGVTPLDRKVTFANASKALVAGNIPNTPAGAIAATDIQAAIDELDTDKLATSGNAASATLASTVTVADESADTTCFPAFFISASGSLEAKTDTSNLTYNSNTGAFASTSFVGALVGNSDTSTLASTITLADESSDTTCFPLFAIDATGTQAAKTDSSILKYNAGTGALAATSFVGALTGNASTVTTNANLTGVVTSAGNATSIAAGALDANFLQAAAKDLGAANVTIDLGNTNGAFVTNLTTDGTITATAGFSGDITGNAATVSTIAGLAPDTATTQATQAAITTCTALVTVGTVATGVWSSSITSANVTNTLQLDENASIGLDPAGSADGKFTGITFIGTGGATIAFGRIVYLNSDGEWYETDADADVTAGAVAVAITVSTTTDGNPVTLMQTGIIRADASFPALTIGAPVYVGVTAGDIQVTAPSGSGDIVKVVGHALTANEILFNPSGDWTEIA